MPLKPCLDCKKPTSGSRCPSCTRTRDRARGTRQERGYDAEHDRTRAAWQRRLDAGEEVVCWRCAEAGRPHLVDPNDWHLGHDDRDRSVYRGPECPAGNLATNGRENLPLTAP